MRIIFKKAFFVHTSDGGTRNRFTWTEDRPSSFTILSSVWAEIARHDRRGYTTNMLLVYELVTQ